MYNATNIEYCGFSNLDQFWEAKALSEVVDKANSNPQNVYKIIALYWSLKSPRILFVFPQHKLVAFWKLLSIISNYSIQNQ